MGSNYYAPTGALDSVTSLQIMDLLKEIAKDKLVIMVTHNPELARDYSTRIIQIKDGIIVGDSNPYQEQISTTDNKKITKTSMSLFTSLALSFENLLTKKGRTILTAIAGSIGIVGIALILALSNGVKKYASSLEKDSLSNFPVRIFKDPSEYFSISLGSTDKSEIEKCAEGKICSHDDVFNTNDEDNKKAKKKNNLKEFKKFLDNNKELNNYVEEIEYDYSFIPQIYTKDYIKVNPHDLSNFYDNSNFSEISSKKEKLEKDYQVLAGQYPQNYNEIVLIVPESGIVNDSIIYSLNILKSNDLEEQQNKINMNEDYKIKSVNYSYEDFLNREYKLILNTDYYKEENGTFIDYSNDAQYINEKIDNGIDLKIVGILTRKNKQNLYNYAYLAYTDELMDYVIDQISRTHLYAKQMENKDINVLNGHKFDNFNNTYDDLVKKLALIDKNDPYEIDIFPKDYESKNRIAKIIDQYNEDKIINKKKDLIIDYSDEVRNLVNTFTSIISFVSTILVGIAAISLIVSSIMIAIITYSSVLERTKEIGILRAIGASKRDISNVFRSETIIEGALAGVIGIGLSLLLIIVANIILQSSFDIANLASLPLSNIILLILLSVVLNVLAGFVPSKIAARKNPVEALRSE